jgi:FkbM family methyltransferase
MSLTQLYHRLSQAVAHRVLLPKQRLAFEYRTCLKASSGYQFKYLDTFGPNRGLALDIGANMGVFSYALAPLYPEVHAFEVNPAMVDILKKAVPKNVTVHHVGLSDEVCTKTLHIPYKNGKMLHGWVSFEDGHCPAADEYRKLEIRTLTLDSLGLKEVGFIKMDVEGHEMKVLAGSRQTILTNRPRLFIEVQPENLMEVQSFMDSVGYQEKSLNDVTGPSGAHGNFLFQPR